MISKTLCWLGWHDWEIWSPSVWDKTPCKRVCRHCDLTYWLMWSPGRGSEEDHASLQERIIEDPLLRGVQSVRDSVDDACRNVEIIKYWVGKTGS